MAAKKTNRPVRGLPENYVPLADLYLAYRKTKVDTFYERELCLGFEFVEFEEKLEENLEAVREMLLTGSWVDDEEVLGGCSFIPKILDFEKAEEGDGLEPKAKEFDCKSIHTVSSRSWEERKQSEENDGRVPVAKFRPMARPSIAWLVISAFWIMKAGSKLDACLSGCTRGSRLRSHKNGGFNEIALGCFAPYSPAYGAWREDGLRAIRHELDEGRGSIAITADLRSFYHSVDPAFIKHEKFKKLIRKIEAELEESNADLTLDVMGPSDWVFTAQMVDSFRAWAVMHQDLLPGESPIGLPIGPGAARVIANLALIGFDRFIEHELQPLYYGRYVDDVFLVLRDGTGITKAKEVWDRIAKLSRLANPSPCVVTIEDESPENDEKVCRLRLDYDLDTSGEPRSDLRFAGKKQKIFFIEGAGGRALLETIEDQIRSNSSEWRLLPELPSFEDDVHGDFLTANPDVTEPADNLRKADRISIRRLKFAYHLRDLEAFSDDLDASQWAPTRAKLYEFTVTQLLALPEFFVYASYLPRIFSLAVHSRDWTDAQQLVRKIGAIFDKIGSDCELDDDHLKLCRHDMGSKLVQALWKSLPGENRKRVASSKELQTLTELLGKTFKTIPRVRLELLHRWPERLFLSDLGRTPYRKLILDGTLKTSLKKAHHQELMSEAQEVLKVRTIRAFLKAIDCKRDVIPRGILFPTRPLSPGEIGLLDPRLLTASGSPRFQRYVRVLRGTHFSAISDRKRNQLNEWFSESDGEHQPIWVPDAEFGDSLRICLPCITLSDESWVASIVQKKDPDLQRYTRITELLNTVLRCKEKPHYIVLPELALKPAWFSRFAHKLEKSGISLISGVEYRHHPFGNAAEDEVINSVRVSLVTRFPGYRTHLLYAQNKERPAPGELAGLQQIGGKRLSPGSSPRRIIRHGDFQFAILICSELSNIKSRADLCGKVDALFVPEWNKDTEGFASLIEATALDLHCYVIQSNNRRYGDSRIRAPYKDAWKRDVLRLKGGSADFQASGEIDFVLLRKFQSSHQSPKKPFKPVPDGFEIHASRKDFPLSDDF